MSTLADLVAQMRAAPEPPPEVPRAPVAGCELITGREIASLAGRLAKHKSENKQTVGRAMLHALRGEVWAPSGARNTSMYQIAAELIEQYPNLDPGSVALAFSAAISNAQSQGSKYTEEKLLSALARVQEERANRIQMVSALGGLAGTGPVPSWPGMRDDDPPPVVDIAGEGLPYVPSEGDSRALALNALGFDTLIIRANGDFYLRTPDRGTFDWKLATALDLRVKMINLFGRENGTVITHQDGEFVGAEKLCEVYARVADRVVHDYTSPATTYNPATCSLHVGLPATLPEPRHDPRVEAWCLELAGGASSDLGELYDWISATTREYIDRPAAALVLSGAKDAGKSLFMLALAGTWGVLPVKLANAVERFGGALLTSPFWHADERMPEEMTDAAFREIVPERVRLIEPKGREKVELRGCGRLVFSINSVDDLRVGTSKGPDAVDAVAGRIAYFDCATRTVQLQEAQNSFRLRGSWDVDLPAMVGHLRYVQTAYTPRLQRFFGARVDNSSARAIVLNQSVKDAGMFLDAICDYIEQPDMWEKNYRANGSFAAPGNAFPIVTKDGRLYLWGGELAARLGARSHERELRPLLTIGRVRLRFGIFRGSYREIDLERLVALRPECAPDLIRTCSGDTSARLGLTTD